MGQLPAVRWAIGRTSILLPLAQGGSSVASSLERSCLDLCLMQQPKMRDSGIWAERLHTVSQMSAANQNPMIIKMH